VSPSHRVARRAATWLGVLCGALAYSLVSLAAQALEVESRSGPVTALVRLLPEEPIIGDPLMLTIEAVAEPGVEILMPDFGEALDRFSIVGFVPRERIDDEGRTVVTQHYTLQAPSSGEHLLPSILIEFIDRRPGQPPAPEDQDAHELLTESLAFSVRSVVPNSAAADLSPPLGELRPRGASHRTLWPFALVACVLIAAGSPFAYRAWLTWRARAAVRSAYELARNELDGLLSGQRASGEQIGAFFVELSGIVRRYLERRFWLRSPELTTERFLEVVSGSPDLGIEHQTQLRDFLRQCDLVKFAHHIPSPESVQHAIRAAERFIDETRDDRTAPDIERPLESAI
jgi:hypothetical protein